VYAAKHGLYFSREATLKSLRAGNRLLALRVDCRTVEDNVQHYRLGDAMKGQFARCAVVLTTELFEGSAFEGERAELGGVLAADRERNRLQDHELN